MKVMVKFDFDEEERKAIAEYYFRRFTPEWVAEKWRVKRGGLAPRTMLVHYVQSAVGNQDISVADTVSMEDPDGEAE